jgi:hypothetical protein
MITASVSIDCPGLYPGVGEPGLGPLTRIGPTLGPGLNQPALLQAMRPGLHRPFGDAQALGDGGDL